LTCKGWQQEAAMRMLMNCLDEEVTERRAESIFGDNANRPARDWESYQAIVETLKQLGNDETLIVKSGKMSSAVRTYEAAPRVLIFEANRRDHSPIGEEDRETARLGLMIHGQTSAASWTDAGAQAILHGTFETFALAAQKHFGGELAGKLVVAGGMGRMGGAQPLAATMNGAAFLGIEVDAERIKRRLRTGYCDICVNSLDEAIRILKNAVRQKQGVSVGLVGNCADIMPEMVRRGIVPDLLTDQTSAHDALNGYMPSGLSLGKAAELRSMNPEEYLKRSYESMARHVTGILELQRLGAVTFEYGNRLRALAFEHGGVKDAFAMPDAISAYIRPQLLEGRGPICCVALSGEPRDINRIDALAHELFLNDVNLNRWIRQARKHAKFHGLPARTCWLGRDERAVFAERINDLVANGELKAPIVIAREDVDGGPESPPRREITDGSNTSVDRPVVNALINSAPGASWASFQSIGGTKTGYLRRAAQAIVADGTPETANRLKRVLMGHGI
jgi:urocanate hydratase